MEHLLNERVNWARMGQASFEHAQAHSLQNTIKHFEEHYGTIVERPRVERRNTTAPRSVVNKSI